MLVRILLAIMLTAFVGLSGCKQQAEPVDQGTQQENAQDATPEAGETTPEGETVE